MKELCYSDFPPEEYAARYARTQQVLGERGLDALFLTGRQNLRYFAGLRDGAWDAPHFYFLVILPVEGDPVLLVSDGFQHLVKQCWIEDVRHWPLGSACYMAKESKSVPLVLEVLQEKGLERGVVGMELGADMQVHMAHSHVAAILEGLPKARIVDGSDAVWALRSVKSSAEIERMRKAAAISSIGVTAGFEALAPGMTEKEVVDVMTSAMCAAGASEQRFNAVYAGPRAMWADGMPTDYVIQPGDLVQFDGGCVYEGYWCDFKRMAAVGEPRPDQRRFYELARQGLDAAIDAVRPGAPFNAPLQAAFAVNEVAGYGDFTRWCLDAGWSAIGHNLGLDLHEQPGLSATNTAPLQENMVICVEPFVTLDGVYPFWEATEKFGLEDVVLVVADGAEVLTSEALITHDLWVV